MRITGVLALCAALSSLVPTAAGAVPFKDTVCPEATQYVVALGSLPSPEDAKDVLDATHRVSAAYETCAKRMLSDGLVEPQVHYAETRQASFEVVEARALLALHRPAEAKTTLEHSKRLAAEVVDWHSGDHTRPNSVYREAAKDVVSAAEALLAKIAATGASSAPAAVSPKPSPSP